MVLHFQNYFAHPYNTCEELAYSLSESLSFSRKKIVQNKNSRYSRTQELKLLKNSRDSRTPGTQGTQEQITQVQDSQERLDKMNESQEEEVFETQEEFLNDCSYFHNCSIIDCYNFTDLLQ